MTRPLLMTSALVLAAAAATPAMAQSVTPFNGFYVGITGGYENYNVEIRPQKEGSGVFDSDGLLNIRGDRFAPNMDGLFYGGLVGYRARLSNNWVVGVEGTLTQSRADRIIQTDNGSVHLNSDLTWGANALAGYLMNERTLVFAKAGYVWNDFGSPVRVDNGNAFDRYDNSETLGGVRLGLGAEWLLTQSISVRAEANYTLYESYRDERIARYVDPDAFQVDAALIFGF